MLRVSPDAANVQATFHWPLIVATSRQSLELSHGHDDPTILPLGEVIPWTRGGAASPAADWPRVHVLRPVIGKVKRQVGATAMTLTDFLNFHRPVFSSLLHRSAHGAHRNIDCAIGSEIFHSASFLLSLYRLRSLADARSHVWSGANRKLSWIPGIGTLGLRKLEDCASVPDLRGDPFQLHRYSQLLLKLPSAKQSVPELRVGDWVRFEIAEVPRDRVWVSKNR